MKGVMEKCNLVESPEGEDNGLAFISEYDVINLLRLGCVPFVWPRVVIGDAGSGSSVSFSLALLA